MIWSTALSLLLLSLVTETNAHEDHPGGMATCSGQAECIRFTFERMGEPTTCADSSCEFKVCMEFDFDNPECFQTEPVHHTCEKSADQCNDYGGFLGATRIHPVPVDYSSCQIVPSEGTAEFSLHHGTIRCGTATKNVTDSVVAYCRDWHNYPGCGENGSAADGECLWRIVAPRCASGGGSGDPHIKPWDGKRFSYHGECDLVMMHVAEFADHAGLDLHIRTKIKDFYSFIESVALRIGSSILEMSSQGIWMDGAEISQLPVSLSGYPLVHVDSDDNGSIYKIELNHGDFIEIHIYKVFVSVNVVAQSDDFENSVGLLGDFWNGDRLARDGRTNIASDDEFGAEWQVRGNEPKLFRDRNRSPQLPGETCKMPSTSAVRRLRKDSNHLKELAEDACSHKNPGDFDFCVFDVIATGDVGMADAW